MARSISWIGNSITMVALPLLVFQLTGSPALTGLTAAIEVAPYLVFGLPAGAVADIWDRKRVMVGMGLTSGVVMATIPLAHAFDLLSVPYVFAAAIIVSSLFVFFDAAAFGPLPEIVGRDRIASATGSMVAVSSVINLAGPAGGGALAAAIGPAWAIGLDAVAYIVAALLTARVAWTPRLRAEDDPRITTRRLARDIGEGLRYIWQTRIIRWLTLIGAGASLSGGAVVGLTVVVAVQQLGMNDDDARIGLLYSATAVGAFLMSMAIAWIQRTVPTGWITIGSLAASWTAQVMWAYVTSIPVGLVILMLFQAASSLTIMNGIIVRQSLAPDHLQARVNTTARMIAWGGTPFGAMVGGLLAENSGTTFALLVCSLGTGAGLALGLVSGIWRVPRLPELQESNMKNSDIKKTENKENQ